MRAFLHRKKAQLKRLEADVEDLRAELESSSDEKGLMEILGDDLDAIRGKAAQRSHVRYCVHFRAGCLE
jgi:hypothetical protein